MHDEGHEADERPDTDEEGERHGVRVSPCVDIRPARGEPLPLEETRMANPVIPRPHVKQLSEACADMGISFQPVARRILEDQARLVKFFRSNLPQMDAQSGEVSLYLFTVVVRIFQQCGGKLPRVGPKEIEAATAKIGQHARTLMPADAGFPERVRGVGDRAQPHILDEALHALFEREEKKDEEIELDEAQAARVFLMLWAATEALDLAWTAPTSPDWADPA